MSDPATPEATTAPERSLPWWGSGLLAVALMVVLMLPGLTEPYGGFLAFSEAWYTLVARGFAASSLLLPQVMPGQPDFNLPPLFAWLLHLGFTLFGSTEAVARLVAMTGAAVAVLATAPIAGGTTAFLVATTPSFVLLGRNVQPDTWSTGLALGAYATWIAHRRGASAILFGLALLTKPTVLLLPFALALGATVAARSLAWVGRRHLIWAASAVVPVVGWIAIQLVLHPGPFLAGLRHGGGAFAWPDRELFHVLGEEVVFAGFPFVVLLAPLGFIRDRSDPALRPAAAVAAVGLLAFNVMHYHSYYLVAYLPAAAVLAERTLRHRRGLAVGLVAANALAALVMLGGHKLGRSEVARLAGAATGAQFVLGPNEYDAYWTLFALYGQTVDVQRGGCALSTAERPVVLFPAPDATAGNLEAHGGPQGLTALGFTVFERPPNPHRLAWGEITYGAWSAKAIGFHPYATTRLRAARLPPGQQVCLGPPVPAVSREPSAGGR